MENIVIRNGLLFDGSTQQEKTLINALYPGKDITIHMIFPGEAHISVSDKKP